VTGLNAEQLEQFGHDGYLVVEGALDPVEVLDPLLAEYADVLDQLANELYAARRISSTHADLPFSERFIQIEIETNETNAQYFDFSLPQSGIRHDTPMWLGQAVFNTLTSPPLLDIVESVVGGEIFSNPVQHIRIKSPERLGARDRETGLTKMGATNWHQDNGVLLPLADSSNILTVWFSLTDASIEHGCLRVLPQSHRYGILAHCPAGPGGLEIPESVISRKHALPLPTRRGDVILFHKRTVHSSLSNVSDEIRWSFDLRYNPIGHETGRGAFPGFIARSRQHPEAELRDRNDWEKLWHDARARLADARHTEPFNRWSADAPVCA